MLRKIFETAVHSLVGISPFQHYFNKLQSDDPTGSPTIEEARKDYIAARHYYPPF